MERDITELNDDWIPITLYCKMHKLPLLRAQRMVFRYNSPWDFIITKNNRYVRADMDTEPLFKMTPWEKERKQRVRDKEFMPKTRKKYKQKSRRRRLEDIRAEIFSMSNQEIERT